MTFVPKVTILGGAGSLGKEFVRYLYGNYELVVVDNNEWAVAELQHEFPDVKIYLEDYDVHKVVGGMVIHCAAYKHVNLGEENVSSFIQNNLLKTVKFYKNNPGLGLLYISTDKAVEPISVYGATKMLAELLTKEYGGQIARCGNFLNSSGSVIPVWEKQIREEQPITITDVRMIRYVSEMSEAIPEIWEKFIEGDKLIIPKVSEVGLVSLLQKVLEKHNYSNIKEYTPGITTIGLRPGEKINERLKWPSEE